MPRDATSPDLEPYEITGIRDGLGPDDKVPLRRDINEWYRSTKLADNLQVQLFLLALSNFQARNEHEKLSYFQIAGIHGMPNIPWNENTKPQAKDQDYCTHNSLLFPFWHRPYIVLFEQVIYHIMRDEIIPSCPTTNPKKTKDTKFQETLLNAAKTWRLPYWDWASTDDLPPLVRLTTFPIDIKEVPKIEHVPHGHIVNPLNHFEMPSKESMGEWGVRAIAQDEKNTKWRPYDKSKGVSRCATFDNETPREVEPPEHWVRGTIDNARAADALRGAVWIADSKDPYTLKENVYRLFTNKDSKKYAAFSTTLYVPSEDHSKDKDKDKDKDKPFDPLGLHNLLNLDDEGKSDVEQSYSSLEFIHNNIHSWIGGPDGMTAGHMADVPVAAFDPVFWLHHVNIDRLCAIWQTLNPDSWFDKREDQLQDPGNWHMAEGTWATPTTPFHPFYQKLDPPTFYNANSVRDWKTLGYTYPQLQPWNYKNHDEYINALCTYINDVYGATKKAINAKPTLSLDPTDLVAGVQDLLGLDNDYVINVVYRKFALGGVPFTISFYLDHHEGSEDIRTRIGRVYNFSSAITAEEDGQCKNCVNQERAAVKASGSIPLTNIMILKAQDPSCPLQTLLPDASVEYLREHLIWDVTDRFGQIIELDKNNPFIQVNVTMGKPNHPGPLHLLSSYSDYTVISKITNNKVGGLGYTPPSS